MFKPFFVIRGKLSKCRTDAAFPRTFETRPAPLLLVAWVGHLFMADVGICQRRRLVWSLGRDLEDDATAVSALDAASGRAVEFITGVIEDRRAEGVLA